MRLHVLGCHGPYPVADGATSGYLLEDGQTKILLDCGSGVLGRLIRICDPASLDAVILTHLHFDHTSDLLVLRYALEIAGKTAALYLPGEDRSPLRAILEQSAYQVRAIPEEWRIGGFEISSMPVRHPVPCRALRITDGQRTLVYTGDTNDCPGLAGFAAGADALLADSAFLSGEWTEAKPHMCAAGAARLAREAGVGMLYLTHLPVRHDPATMEAEARGIFERVQAVRPGQVIAL